MIPVWPASLPQLPRRSSWTGGPVEERVKFKPDRGPAIERRGPTALTEVFTAVFPNFSTAQRIAFRGFFQDDLAQGSTPFAWRDPVVGDVALWSITGQDQAYSFTAKGAGLHDLSLTMMRRPGTPWWAGYVPDGDVRLPAVVADYAGGVFGIGQARVPAADVAAVAGVFDVWTTTDLGVTTIDAGATVLAGDIPATAPLGVARIVAFVP